MVKRIVTFDKHVPLPKPPPRRLYKLNAARERQFADWQNLIIASVGELPEIIGETERRAYYATNVRNRVLYERRTRSLWVALSHRYPPARTARWWIEVAAKLADMDFSVAPGSPAATADFSGWVAEFAAMASDPVLASELDAAISALCGGTWMVSVFLASYPR